MGAPRARKAVEEDVAPSITQASSDEDEANCDLSLEIVERAKRRAVQESVNEEFAAKGEELVMRESKRKGKGGKKVKKMKNKNKKRTGAEEIGDGIEMNGTKIIKNKKSEKMDGVVSEGIMKRKGDDEDETTELFQIKLPVDEAVSVQSKRKRRKKRKQGKGLQDELVRGNVEVLDATNQDNGLNTVGKEVPAGSQDSSVTDLNESSDTENAVLKKLLRVPRYFDTENTAWKMTCFNCGEEGHLGMSCTAEKRKKPCFLCGEFGHNFRHCPRGLECYICKKVGHAAKDCAKKQKKDSQNLKICLRCGEDGHEMTFCTNDYSPADLNQIQCYICGRTGHLCCFKFADASSVALSCYNCGKTGHTGFGCAKPRWQVSADHSTTVCHLCGEEGHFARGCTKRAESARRKKEASTPRNKIDRVLKGPRWNKGVCTPERHHDLNRQSLGSRSAPREGKVDNILRLRGDDRSKTARKPRIRNILMAADDLDTVSSEKHRPSTPKRIGLENHYGDHCSQKKATFHSNNQRPFVYVNKY